MKEKTKQKNYRRIYEQKCNIKIPKGYEIHHIDFNRDNNNIMNLVALPKELHNKYHTLLRRYKSIHYEVQTELKSILELGSAINAYIKNNDLKIIGEFIDVWYECQHYVLYRDQSLGIIPPTF